jgi:hypothetical protein
MAITFPLSAPATPGFRAIQWTPRTVVGMAQSPFTGAQQTYAHPGQWWEVSVTLPPMTDAQAGAWCGFFLALNGREGTFYLGDTIRKTRLGAVTGTLTVGSGAVANTTTLPIAGATGSFAVGDWIQVGTTSTSRLHRVTQVNSSSSVDVFPRLRSAYTNGTAITYASPKGLFRLQGAVPWAYDARKICDGLTFSAVEVVP